MATGTLAPAPYLTVLDGNGNPVSGAKIYTYLAGTTTLVATYTEVTLTTANANPIVADASGRFVAFLTPGASYKFVIQTSAGVAIRTQDNISAVPPSSSNLDITGTFGETVTAGAPVYESDGSGGKNAGSWYLTDSTNAYSSTLPNVGFAPSAVASGATGTIRQGGQVAGQSALVLGSTYYLSTSGTISVTPPATNPRAIGVADTTSSLIMKFSTGRVAGVSFPATQLPSTDVNTLDDYEEGTWTPVIGGSGGTSGQTYSLQRGTYTKIGKLVIARFYVILSAKGTVTTNVQIQGLPFAVAVANSGVWPIAFNGLNTNWIAIVADALSVSTAITLTGNAAAGTSNLATFLATADLTNTTGFSGVLAYEAAS